MNENTRKYYIAKGEEFEKASEYESALNSYLEAFSVVSKSDDDVEEYFAPGFIEDRIAFLAYRLGKYRIALTYGAKAYRANPNDERLKSNLPFYTDAILFTNPKNRIDRHVADLISIKYEKDATILDIGPYDGRWADILSDFPHKDAVEAFEPYIERFKLNEKYEHVFNTNILDFDFDFYNIIIMGDVLEHLTVEESQKLLEKLKNKCEQLIIIVPYEYPQDEYDNNEFQVHKQEDLTDEIFNQRYPGFHLFAKDEVRGCYIKKMVVAFPFILGPIDDTLPKTYTCGNKYFELGLYSQAAGVFNQSLEKMSDENKALMKYKLGLCYKNMGKKLESLKAFIESVEVLPNYRHAYFEIMRILEDLQLWEDLEHYVKLALEHCDDVCPLDASFDEYWKSLLLIQMTLALSKQGKDFEAFGYACLAKDVPTSEERKKIADYNYEEIKKGLWGTMQIND